MRIEDSITSIPFKAICHRKTSLEDITANLNGHNLQIQLNREKYPLITGTLQIPDELPRRELSRLILLYEMEATPVPLLLANWKPKEAKAKVFQANIVLPDDYYIFESFPTVSWERQVSDQLSSFTFDLQVIPAWIDWKMQKGSAPFLSFNRIIDLLVITVLVLLGFWLVPQLKTKNL